MDLFTIIVLFAVFWFIMSVVNPQFCYPRDKSQVSSNWKSLVDKGIIKVGTNKRKIGTTSKDGKTVIADSLVENKMVSTNSFDGLTHTLAMDCEMVGVGEDGSTSILARVSIVNNFGHCVYDKFVKPTERVTDYRTNVSGIRKKDVEDGEDFKLVQKEVYEILKGRILVGHAIKNDLKVLFIDHPRSKIRDTSQYFRKILGGKTPSLKRLTSELVGANIQSGEHDSIQDARAAMRLYTMHKKAWEKQVASRRRKRVKSSN